MISELRSETLKERHWNQIMKNLGVAWNLSEINLGEIWQTDLFKCESLIRDILITAQGEKALEEYLKQVIQ